ncbi:MAG: methylated-DNA--[protein]-cysteine S-methyltransferase, partial [Anaerolineae bacterium]|nr:methylated-DNA--[protein]-cysteine S-methyltransferase [Anaerolineae bacterium]MDW8173352.1 methylated-DNA--[protein]-cysteine S-methyltransferase [Anaerolineae bacterium]
MTTVRSPQPMRAWGQTTVYGHLLVAMTAHSVAFVGLYDGAQEAQADLRTHHPQVTITQDEAVRSLIEAIIGYLEGYRPVPDLALDIQTTTFRWRVWYELRRIPRGQARTYSQVAKAVGQPQAARAVASACASNPLAILIPCHRVIGSDGSLRGYRWGVAR